MELETQETPTGDLPRDAATSNLSRRNSEGHPRSDRGKIDSMLVSQGHEPAPSRSETRSPDLGKPLPLAWP